MPRRAASEMPPMIATGMAISSGQGVATTSTARKRIGWPLIGPGCHGNGDGQRRVQCAQLIGEAANSRPALLRFLHHAHDLGVARIDRPARGTNHQRRFAVDRARKHLRAPAFSTSGTARRSGTIRPSRRGLRALRHRPDRFRAGRPPVRRRRAFRSSGTSSSCESRRRCATDGMRLANARNAPRRHCGRHNFQSPHHPRASAPPACRPGIRPARSR